MTIYFTLDRMLSTGRTPVLLDRSVSPPLPVFESNAILLYLADKYKSPLLPRAPAARSEVEQWLMWQISALGPMLGQCMYMKRIATCANEVSALQFSIDRFHAECVRLLQVLETRLKERDYLCGPGRGEFSLADLACHGYAYSHWWAGISVEEMPALRRWLDAVAAKPSVQRGLKVPGVRIVPLACINLVCLPRSRALFWRGSNPTCPVDVPGVSVLGPSGYNFLQIATEPEVQKALVDSAAANGRVHLCAPPIDAQWRQWCLLEWDVRARLRHCLPSLAAAPSRGSNWLDMRALANQGEINGTAFTSDARPPSTVVAGKAELLPTARDVAIAAGGLLLGLAIGKALAGAR